jgi:cytochrome c oxidase subunit I+III
MRRCVRRLRTGHSDGLVGSLLGAAGCGVLGCAAIVALLVLADLVPTRSAHDAVLVFTLAFLLVHGALATVLTALQAARVWYGYVGLHAPYEPVVVGMVWLFTTGAVVASWIAVSLLPLAFVR